MNERALTLAAGADGNFLLTRRANYRKCSVKLDMALTRGTEAFLALRAARGPDGWNALTSRVVDVNGTVRVGHQSLDFRADESGTGLKEFATDTFITVTFEDNGRGTRRVLVKGKPTSVMEEGDNADGDGGSVGLFVKSGTVVIRSVMVEE